MSELQNQRKSGLDWLWRSRVRRNSLWLVGGDTLAKLVGMLTTLIYARVLGSKLFGAFELAQSFTTLFSIFPDMGLHRWGVCELAQKRGESTGLLAALYRARRRFAGYTLLAGLVAGLLLVWGKERAIWLYAVLSIAFLTMCLRGIKQVYETAFHGHQDMAWPARFNVIFRLLTLAVIPLLAWLSKSVVVLLLGLLAIEALDFLVERAAARNLYKKAWQGVAKFDTTQIVREALPFSVQIIASMIYFRIDSLMLYLIRGDWQLVGLYGAGYRLVLAALVIPSSLSAALFPALAQRSRPESFRLYLKSLPLYLLLGFGFVGVVYPFREFWVNFIFSKAQFGGSIPLLGVLTWVFPLYCLTMTTGNYLGATGRQVWVMIVCIMMALSNIILNYLWIPELGGIGAALATVATELIGLLGFAGCFLYARYVAERPH